MFFFFFLQMYLCRWMVMIVFQILCHHAYIWCLNDKLTNKKCIIRDVVYNTLPKYHQKITYIIMQLALYQPSLLRVRLSLDNLNLSEWTIYHTDGAYTIYDYFNMSATAWHYFTMACITSNLYTSACVIELKTKALGPFHLYSGWVPGNSSELALGHLMLFPVQQNQTEYANLTSA